MRITYLKLQNVAGIQVGLGLSELEINFANSHNRIIAIVARNGSGKTVLLSSLTPFANVTALDDRSTLSYVTPHKNGFKEIHFADGEDEYIIKHYFKANKESHSVKSYFMKNGEELNPNGNVTSFNDLVEIHMGLTQEMMRLLRIGSNVSSFISLTPSQRKAYIGKLIEEIDLYMSIYKKINDDIKVVKTLSQSNATNLYNCHITDPVVETENLKSLKKEIKSYEAERDKIVSKISKIEDLIRDNDINELRHRLNEAENSVDEFDKLSNQISRQNMQNVTVDALMDQRNELTNKRIDVQSQISSLRLSIDGIHKTIERLESNIKRITSNNDLRSLINGIESIKDKISDVPQAVINFNPTIKSEDLQVVLNKLYGFNNIGKMIYTFGNKPIAVYISLKRSNKNIDKWLKEQAKKSLNRMNETDVKSLIDQVFGDESIVSPNCEDQYIDCPYYRLHSVITDIRDRIEEESYSDETLRYIQIISNNIDNILNEIDHIKVLKIPDRIMVGMTESNILNRLEKKLQLFDVTDLQEYITITKEHEVYVEDVERLNQYEQQLHVYQQAGIEGYTHEIQSQNQLIESYKNQIGELNSELNEIQKGLDNIESKIVLVTKYKDAAKYQKMMHSTIDSTRKILEPLENAVNEKQELQFQLRNENNLINMSRDRYNTLERKLDQYNRLLDEGKKLSKQNKDLNIILEAVSTRKGIPVIYMKKYLGKIQKLANDLLRLIYEDEFRLAPFNVTPDEFNVPYVKSGTLVKDLKYASQSEIALGTMAISFALATNSTGKYNILALDEIDSGLDAENRNSFLKMLINQMNLIGSEQVFIISQNLSQLSNLELDVIRLDDSVPLLKLQHVIYSN